jgi:integrase
VEALLSTGCRVGELLHLQWREVRLDDKGRPALIELPAYKTKTGETRVLPVNERLAQILEFRRHDPLGNPLPLSAYVFGTETGERIACVKTAWRATCARAGIEGLRLHDLRREVGSRLLECAAPIHEVRDVLGHANVAMTSRYLKSATTGLARTLDRLATWKDAGIRTPFAHEPSDDPEPESDDAAHLADTEEDEVGSSGWTRTSNPPVNSRMLCH